MDIEEHVTAEDFSTTLKRVEDVITKAGLTIFARIDHAAGAREVGMMMPPTMVLIYGSPKGGTPIMRDTPQAALDLPLRVLIREGENGKTVIGFHPIVPVLHRLGVAADLAARLSGAQRILLAAVVS